MHPLPTGPRPAELPTAAFLGSPSNELLAATYLPGAGRLFATSQGLLLLLTASAAEFASFEPAPATDAIAPRALLRSVRLPSLADAPRLAQLDVCRRLWLADSQGLLLLTPRQWRAAMRGRIAGGTAAR